MTIESPGYDDDQEAGSVRVAMLLGVVIAVAAVACLSALLLRSDTDKATCLEYGHKINLPTRYSIWRDCEVFNGGHWVSPLVMPMTRP